MIPIVGEDPLLTVTLDRFEQMVPEKNQIVVTTKALFPPMKAALQEYPDVTILCEPESRNTMPCIVMTMEWIRAKDPNAVVVVVPADHWITDVPEYIRLMELAAHAAQKNALLYTVGIQPTRAETGFGYIRSGERIADEVFAVERFVEKPSKEVAEDHGAKSGVFMECGNVCVVATHIFFRSLLFMARLSCKPFRNTVLN